MNHKNISRLFIGVILITIVLCIIVMISGCTPNILSPIAYSNTGNLDVYTKDYKEIQFRNITPGDHIVDGIKITIDSSNKYLIHYSNDKYLIFYIFASNETYGGCLYQSSGVSHSNNKYRSDTYIEDGRYVTPIIQVVSLFVKNISSITPTQIQTSKKKPTNTNKTNADKNNGTFVLVIVVIILEIFLMIFLYIKRDKIPPKPKV